MRAPELLHLIPSVGVLVLCGFIAALAKHIDDAHPNGASDFSPSLCLYKGQCVGHLSVQLSLSRRHQLYIAHPIVHQVHMRHI